MSRNGKARLLAWLVAAVLPFQALTAVYLDVRGPGHVHVGGGAGHSHDGIGHHYHASDDASVVLIHDGSLLQAALEDETSSGRSSLQLSALPAGAAPSFHPRTRSHAAIFRSTFPQPQPPQRLERPPRLFPV
jgi:hypothetical protein